MFSPWSCEIYQIQTKQAFADVAAATIAAAADDDATVSASPAPASFVAPPVAPNTPFAPASATAPAALAARAASAVSASQVTPAYPYLLSHYILYILQVTITWRSYRIYFYL